MIKRIVLVTGAAGGIGSAICKRFCHKGYSVIAAVQNAQEPRTKGLLRELKDYPIAAFEGDVSDFGSMQAMGEKILQQYPGVDILVNAAGITRDQSFLKMTPDNWHAVMKTNLDALFNVTQQFLGQMVENGFGRVINISSVNGQKGQFGQTNYAAAKAGMHGFTMSLAQEVAKKGVTVNTISPGYTDTTMMKGIPEKILEDIISRVPVKRLAAPEEIAHVVYFLAHDQSGYITGANIPVNGGLFMH